MVSYTDYCNFNPPQYFHTIPKACAILPTAPCVRYLVRGKQWEVGSAGYVVHGFVCMESGLSYVFCMSVQM